MRLREDAEPASGVKRPSYSAQDRLWFASALQHASPRSGASETHAETNQGSSQPTCVCVCLNDGYHNAANSPSRERLQPANAVLLRLQSVQCSRSYTQQ